VTQSQRIFRIIEWYEKNNDATKKEDKFNVKPISEEQDEDDEPNSSFTQSPSTHNNLTNLADGMKKVGS